MNTYPMYFRKAGRCMKVISPTEAMVITLPPEAIVPLRHHATFPSAERMEEHLLKMQPVGDDIWRNFLFTFYHGVKKEHEQIAITEKEIGGLSHTPTKQ